MHGQSVCGIQTIAVIGGSSEMQSQFTWQGLFKLPAAVFTNSEYFLTLNIHRQA